MKNYHNSILLKEKDDRENVQKHTIHDFFLNIGVWPPVISPHKGIILSNTIM